MHHKIPLLANFWHNCFLGAEGAEQLLPTQPTALRAPDRLSTEDRLMSGMGRAGLGSVDVATGSGTAPTPPGHLG